MALPYLDARFGRALWRFGRALWTRALDARFGRALWTRALDARFGRALWTRANAHEPEKFPPSPEPRKWCGKPKPRYPPQAFVRSGAASRALGAGFLRWR